MDGDAKNLSSSWQTNPYVRINMLFHNLNKGVHLVEVKVDGPGPAGDTRERESR